MAGVGLTVPIMLPLEVCAVVVGTLGVCVKLVRRKLMKAEKHGNIKVIADSIKDLISKALQDGHISDDEFRMVLCELEIYNDLKDKTHTKQSGLSESEKKVHGRRKSTGTECHSKKDKKYVLNCCSNIFEYEPPPSYEQC